MNTHRPSLGERILVRTQVHHCPGLVGLLLDEVLDVCLGIFSTCILVTIRQDDEGRDLAGALDSLANSVKQCSRPARLECLASQGSHILEIDILISHVILVVKLNQCELASQSLLVRHEGVEPSNRVVPARLH